MSFTIVILFLYSVNMILFCVIDELLKLDLSKSHVMNNFKEPLLPTGKKYASKKTFKIYRNAGT